MASRMADQSKEALQKRPFDARELLAQHHPVAPTSPSLNQSGQPVSVVMQIGALLNSSRGTLEQAIGSPFTSAVHAVQQPPMPSGILNTLNFGQFSYAAG